MIEISEENLISIRDAPRHLPPRPSGKRIHISAVYRWIGRGVRGVRLEALKIGGSTYTSIEALQRFGDRLTAKSSEHSESVMTTPRRRKQEIEQAARTVQEQLEPGGPLKPLISIRGRRSCGLWNKIQGPSRKNGNYRFGVLNSHKGCRRKRLSGHSLWRDLKQPI